MIDEALQYAIDFCHQDLLQEEVARRGEVIVQSIHDRLIEIGDKREITNFVLGGVLKRLKEKDTWKLITGSQPFWTFGDFCKEMTGKSLGSCYEKIRVWEKSQKVGMRSEEVERLGTIADHILRLSKDRSDVDRLIQRYDELGSRSKFLNEMRAQNEEKPPTERVRKNRYVKLDESEDQFYSSSLELAAEKAGRELHRNMNESEALLFLIAQWREGLN